MAQVITDRRFMMVIATIAAAFVLVFWLVPKADWPEVVITLITAAGLYLGQQGILGKMREVKHEVKNDVAAVTMRADAVMHQSAQTVAMGQQVIEASKEVLHATNGNLSARIAEVGNEVRTATHDQMAKDPAVLAELEAKILAAQQKFKQEIEGVVTRAIRDTSEACETRAQTAAAATVRQILAGHADAPEGPLPKLQSPPAQEPQQ